MNKVLALCVKLMNLVNLVFFCSFLMRLCTISVCRKYMYKFRLIFTLLSVLGLSVLASGCASSLPSNFVYETSLRGEQGLPGRAQRLNSAKTLLAESGAKDPEIALQAALPDAEVKVKRWGVKYFGKDWARYQVVLDADIKRGDNKTKCRESSTEEPVGAPLLDELLANDGAEFTRQMESLAEKCIKLSKR